MRTKHTIEEMRETAIYRGGKCLSNIYKNIDSKLKWRCKNRHIWEATPYQIINRKNWCPLCAGKYRNIEQMREIAKNKGGTCLSKEYKGYKKHLEWECSKGHRWKAVPSSIYALKTWCPFCAKNVKLILEDLKKVAEQRGGKCLSKKYINVDSNYLWQCSLGHKFKNTFSHIKNGKQWCPICNKATISEEFVRTTLEQMTNKKFPKTRPNWLKNDRGNQMEFDGFCKELKVAFEYHGIQHFKLKSHFITEQEVLDQRIKDDKTKEKVAEKYGVKLLVLDYKMKPESFVSNILKQAKRKNIDLSIFKKIDSVDLDKAYIRTDRLKELKSIVESKNGTLLSRNWLGTQYKYKVICNKCDHKWSTDGASLLLGSWCKKCAMKELAKNRTGNIDNVSEFARSFGGVVLNKKYLGADGKYDFICKKGHKFSAKLNNLKFRKQWCPDCRKK